MALMSYELYDALLSVHVDEEKARKAAEAVAASKTGLRMSGRISPRSKPAWAGFRSFWA
jgi:hypothetical protein